ncbi:MAG: hypothetical protein DRI30_02830 [Chloroflexi bacterium]|nr:MAG: hypothetical protein DRI30_02830 [Chloroflexota bacterium]
MVFPVSTDETARWQVSLACVNTVMECINWPLEMRLDENQPFTSRAPMITSVIETEAAVALWTSN